ncbi:MarR family winged helix-turn-helix transcriptional regulator [Microbacterium telephonicum]|uniref:TrmB family transcriptional regulator /MarR family transcriptional regulator n=1 Tax=Microbacterium telephonicum TaxID=1714841 RepID=A0A498C065_9MICO|nr:MarR family transcriptional regulator [Microbacterium telephonicum]RLK46550.1 TrmB family transcriptional regulator /MarR family transcriptional regulator [Microbacterium telephonicum]
MAAVDQLVCFSLYQASRATTQVYRRLLAPWNLTYPQYLVLVQLWIDGLATVSQLGDDLDLDSGTLSPLLRRMERADLLVRERGEGDARIVTVRLTERGRALQSEMAEVSEELLRCTGFTLDSAVALRESLHRLTDSLHTAR